MYVVLSNNTTYSANSTNLQQIHTAYSNQVNTACRSPDTVAVVIFRIRSPALFYVSLPRERPTDHLLLSSGNRLMKDVDWITMAKPILDEAHTKPSLTELKTDNDVKIEISEELLKELRNNAYSGRVEEDVIDHIAKFLEILDLIKIANVDPFELQMKVFPLSLAGDARKWWMNEGDDKINTWEELVKK
uniref:Reverse transcriptase domain-containing protein n=1 Tax=Tanacetum cinerariifolium TaxID=118510 RepID=A0A6L2NJ34_TANCI|nr:hypothetical protein [Tanacetum cinerariifolium]